MKRTLGLFLLITMTLLGGCGKISLGDCSSANDDTTIETTESSMVPADNEISEKNDAKDTSMDETKSIIIADGNTLEARFSVPEGYERVKAEEDSLASFLREYKLEEDGSPVLLYDGTEKGNQSAHAAVFSLPIESYDLQQCADSVMRVYAEYYWQTEQQDKIAFHFTNGFLCEYTRWREGYRVKVNGNDVSWSKEAAYDDTYESFTQYMKTVFTYAGTLSMESMETETISLAEMTVGDVIIKGGSPGHVVMVVDVCENADGKKAYLLAQGYMPAQEFHVINNPKHGEDPWYYEEEMTFPLRTAEYTFSEERMIRRLTYSKGSEG